MQLRVKELREEKGWNQTVLGYHAGLSPSQISLIENGRRNPTVETLQGIATALGVGVGDLFPKAEASPEQESPERRLINAVAPAVVAAQKSWEAYLEELPEQPTAKVWKKERKRIKELLTDASEMYEGLEEQGVLEAMEPYVAAIEGGESIPQPFRRNIIGLFNALAAMFVYTIPKANNWASRFEERLQLENIDSVAPEWAAKDRILETGTAQKDA